MQKSYGKRERNKRQRKESLYVVAMDLFRRQGFEETRVEEITRAAGVAKGTFFNYFPTKEDVLLYIGERHMSRLGVAMANGSGKQLTQERSAVAGLKFLLRTMALSLEDDKDLVRLAVSKAMKIAHLAPTKNGGDRFSFQGLVAILLARGQRSGEIDPAINPELVAQMVQGLYYQQLVTWCQSDFSYDLAGRLDQVIDVLAAGIRSRPQA